MFDMITRGIAGFMAATIMTVSNVMPMTPVIAENSGADLTYQSIELYPNGEDAEQIVTLDGMMPDGAKAEAVDVSEDYDGAAAYDITIRDGRKEYQPGEEHPIFVEITDPVITERIELWHIHDDGNKEQLFDFTAVDGKVSFYATGFSVYEIVKDEVDYSVECTIVPVTGDTSSFDTYTAVSAGENVRFTYDAVPKEYPQLYGTAVQITSIDDFKANIANGIYISGNRFHLYVKNTACDINGSRPALAVTDKYDDSNNSKNLFNATTSGAVKYYFEENSASDNKYYIYTYDDENDINTKKYVNLSSNNALKYSTNNPTVWVVSMSDNSFRIKCNNNNCYWTEKGDTSVKGFAAYLSNNPGAGEKFDLWSYTPPDFSTDPYGLDGCTYGLVSFKDTNNGNALIAGNYNSSGTSIGNIPVSRTVNNETSAVSYSSYYGITDWRFDWVEGTAKYRISAVADDGAGRKYLKVSSDGVSLVADAAEASEITVTPDSNNRIQLSADGYKINCNNNTNFNASNNSTTFFDLVNTSSAPADTLSLDGKTYALVYKQNDTTGNALVAKTDSANANRLDNQIIECSGDVYKYTGELSGWTFSNVDTNRYIISNGSKYLKLVKDRLTLSDEPFILTVSAGTGDYAGKVEIRNTTDVMQVTRGGNDFYSVKNNAGRWLDLVELTTPPESDPFELDGKTYGIINKVNDAAAYSMTYDAKSTTQLNGKKADCVSGEPKYKSYGSPVGWTFHWQGYGSYKISVDTGADSEKWLKFNSSGLSVVDESEATVVNVTAGTGSYEGKIRISPVLDNSVSAISRNNSGNEYYFQRGTNSFTDFLSKGQYWHELITFNLNDPYKLNGKKFSLLHYTSGANGHALTASEVSNALNMLTCVVRPENGSQSKVLYVAKDTDITEWTFQSVSEDKYYIYADFGGIRKYLSISSSGVTVSETETPQAIQVIPDVSGKIRLASDGYSILYHVNSENQNDDGRFISSNESGDYLYFISQTEINDDEYVTYKAKEVSVSDVRNGDQVIIYTRVWNGSGYDFCAIDHDGSLVPCYERGDSIMWLSSKVNTLIWDFTEYYYEYTDTPNNYYDLYNPYSGKYIVPKRSSGMTLSNEPIGINLEGRRYGEYYSTILAWDQQSYAYSGLKADITGKVDGNDDCIATSARSKADTFYFATVVDYSNELTEVETVDNTQYGITMQMVNFSDKTLYGDKHNEQDHILGDYTVWEAHQKLQQNNILSTNLESDGYPRSMNPDNDPNSSEHTTHSLKELYQDATNVNHLFIQSILEQSGYFEFDSCQNYATLKNNIQSKNENGDLLYLVIENGKETIKAYGENDTVPSGAKPIYDFFVSKEIGTHDASKKTSLQHGQFYPYDDIDMESYASESINGLNLYDARQVALKDSDPRKYERLHLIEDPDYYFGMQLDANFTQTPDGKDDWGHDIIFEFTGDDDFWLYVDGELVIDLGGIHSALGGDVNFATGIVKVDNCNETNLRDVFVSNYRARGMTDEEIIEELKNHFDYDKSITDPAIEDFETVFKDYSSHTMKIFYMERGAGASNIHMRFNLNYVTPGDVVMTKELTGSDDVDFELVEYPFQIWYSNEVDAQGNVNTAPEHMFRLTPNEEYISVKYQNSTRDVIYQETYTPPGSDTTYENVYFINPNQSVEIHFPEDTTFYSIKECGINSSVYEHVYVNGDEITGQSTVADNSPFPKRMTFQSDWKRVSERANIVFTNQVNPDALRPLFFQKKLYDADYQPEMTDAQKEEHKINADQDPTTFSFRLYLSNGITNERTLTNMVKYRVISPDGKYCTWNMATQQFDKSQYNSSGDAADVNSLKYALDAIANNENLTAEEKAEQKEALLEPITFETSINGQISEIRAWYTVEVPNIPAGVTFEVEERDSSSERPLGYDRVQYERIEGTYLTIDGENDNVGIIRASDTPHMNVINQRGYEIQAQKIWSDKDFALGHDDIYLALCIRNGNSYELAPADIHPVRRLSAPDTDIRFFMQTLANGKALSDYEIFEINMTGIDFAVDEDGYVTGYDPQAIITNRIIDAGFAAIHATDRAGSGNANGIVFTDLVFLDTSNAASWSEQLQFDSGSQLYGDSDTIKAKSIPAKLRGAEYLRTADASGSYNGDLCTFTAGAASAVYVAIDSNIAAVPAWLNEEPWKRTDDTIVTTDDTTLILYKRNYSKGDTVTLGKNGGSSSDKNYIVLAAPNYSYKTDYEKGSEINPVTINGRTYTARGDSITNIRQGGIQIILYEMGTRNEAGNNYGTPLPGGVFVLKKGDEVIGTYTSDENGKITIMYSFEKGQDYVLTQLSAPGRYFGVPKPITFSVGDGDDPIITVTGNAAKWNDSHKPYVEGDKLVAYIDVYNKPFKLKAVKVDSEDRTEKLAGAHFALYRGVNSVDGLIPDTSPINGCEDLVTDSEGVIPDVTEYLRDGTYFLRETQPSAGYKLFERPIRFSIHEHDLVLFGEAGGAVISQSGQTQDGKDYEIITSNAGVQLIKTDGDTYDCVLSVPNEKDESNYYFDIEKIIFVDKNVHNSDTEQKFVFRVERFEKSETSFADSNIKESFYVTLNCNKEIDYSYSENGITDPKLKWYNSENELVEADYNYSLYTDGYADHSFDAKNKKVSVTYDNGTKYTYPAAVWNGKKTVHVTKDGIYRISEVKKWSSTDYDFWNGSNCYKGYGDGTKGEPVIADGFRDSKTSGDDALTESDKECVYINVDNVKASEFESASKTLDGKTVWRPTASFTNSETEYAYLSSQAYADNTINRSSS